MPEQWLSKPKLPPEAKLRVRKLAYQSDSEPKWRLVWCLMIPQEPIDGMKRWSFIHYDTWEEAHNHAFTIRDYIVNP